MPGDNVRHSPEQNLGRIQTPVCCGRPDPALTFGIAPAVAPDLALIFNDLEFAMKWFRPMVFTVFAAFALTLVVSDYAHAQDAFSGRTGNRKAKRDAERAKKNQGKEEELVNPYPNSSRADVNSKWSAKLSKFAQKGIDAYNEQNYPVAQQQFGEVIANDKASAFEKAYSYQILGAVAYESEEDSVKAMDYNSKAIELDALPNEAHFGLIELNAQLALQEDQFDQAIQWADRFLKETASEKDLMYAVKGQAYYQQEKFAQAAENLKKALEVSEKPRDNWTPLLLLSYADAGMNTEAIAFGEKALIKDPRNKTMITQMSNLYIDTEQQGKALALMDRAYADGVLASESELRQLAQLYAFAEQPARGAEIVQEGIDKGILKEGLATFSLLGDIYAQGDDAAKALAAYAKAEPFAKDGDMAFQQAYWLYNLDRFEEARAKAKEALSRVPFKHEGDCWLTLGNAEIALDNKAGAIAAFKKATQFPNTKASAESWLKNAARM